MLYISSVGSKSRGQLLVCSFLHAAEAPDHSYRAVAVIQLQVRQSCFILSCVVVLVGACGRRDVARPGPVGISRLTAPLLHPYYTLSIPSRNWVTPHSLSSCPPGKMKEHYTGCIFAVHMQYMYSTCTVHVQYICSTHAVHMQCI